MTVPAKDTELLSRKEAATFLGVTAETLAVWACLNRYNLPFVKVGRLAKYRKADGESWLESRTVNAPVEAAG